MGALQDGEVLVTDITDPDWEPVMKRARRGRVEMGGKRTSRAVSLFFQCAVHSLMHTLALSLFPPPAPS